MQKDSKIRYVRFPKEESTNQTFREGETPVLNYDSMETGEKEKSSLSPFEAAQAIEDYEERLEEYMHKKREMEERLDQEKLQNMRKLAQKELEECTFTPNIKGKKSIKYGISQEKLKERKSNRKKLLVMGMSRDKMECKEWAISPGSKKILKHLKSPRRTVSSSVTFRRSGDHADDSNKKIETSSEKKKIHLGRLFKKQPSSVSKSKTRKSICASPLYTKTSRDEYIRLDSTQEVKSKHWLQSRLEEALERAQQEGKEKIKTRLTFNEQHYEKIRSSSEKAKLREQMASRSRTRQSIKEQIKTLKEQEEKEQEKREIARKKAIMKPLSQRRRKPVERELYKEMQELKESVQESRVIIASKLSSTGAQADQIPQNREFFSENFMKDRNNSGLKRPGTETLEKFEPLKMIELSQDSIDFENLPNEPSEPVLRFVCAEEEEKTPLMKERKKTLKYKFK